MQNKTRPVFIIMFLLGFILSFSKFSYAFNKGEIYNKEAQNIVNTADLIIKAEHSYSQNTYGEGFADLLKLERNKPPYLSPMEVYTRNNSECVRKTLMQSKVYICVNPASARLNIFLPVDSASLNLVAREISKGITGQSDQVSERGGLPVISFSFISAGKAIFPSGSITVSPNANGGTTYANTNPEKGNIMARVAAIIVNFLTSAISFM